MPNPQRSSACDCTCVLTRIDHCFVTLSSLPYAFCFVSAHAKFAHEFLTLFHRMDVQLIFSFPGTLRKEPDLAERYLPNLEPSRTEPDLTVRYQPDLVL